MHRAAAGTVALSLALTVALAVGLGSPWAVRVASAQSGPPNPFAQPPAAQATTPVRPLPPRGQTPGRPGAMKGRGGPSLWTTLGSLAVVLTLIVVGAKVWRKAAPTGGRVLPAAALDVLGRRSLDNRHAVTLLRCGSRVLVLGFSPQGMHTLAEVTDPAEVDFLSGLCRPSGESTPFAQAFWDVFRREPPTDANPETGPASSPPTQSSAPHREAYAPHA